jgi:type IV pilus assembly protein PilY1
MHRLTSKALQAAFIAALVFGAAAPTRADDSEIFFTTTVSGGNANLMLVIDTSGSMGLAATTMTAPYDSTLTYLKSRNEPTKCNKDLIYYRANDPLNTEPPKSCDDPDDPLASIPKDSNKCAKAASALAFGSDQRNRPGYYQDFLIRWGGSGSNRTWNATLSPPNAASVECFKDAGVHGESGASNPYPRSGNSSNTTGRWGSKDQQWWSSSNEGVEVILWSPNYIAYTRSPPQTTEQTRMEVVKEAAINLLTEVTDMNVGLMRYDTAGNGGMVLAPARPIDEGTNRQDLIDLVNSLRFAGNTPLTETLSEAYRYFAGEKVHYGNDSKACKIDRTNANCSSGDMVTQKSVASSRSPATADGAYYDSPADAACQNNYVVFLTDGLPNNDNDADSFISGLPGAVCDASGPSGASPSTAGRCLSALTRYMYENDLRSTVEGTQNVKTYFIGFGDDFSGELNDSFQYLDIAAQAGGGRAFQANSLAALQGAFNSIVSDVVQTNTMFTSPTVAVNAFNRTQTLEDLYVAVFAPSITRHWPGNLKKYKVVNGAIKDSNGNDAVDDSGFFTESARSYWSTVNDGFVAARGGAASKIPGANARKLYTYIGTGSPGSMVPLANHVFDTSNSDLDSKLGLGAAGDPDRDDLIDWARGTDVQDKDPVNGNNTEPRRVMGDPMHSRPTVVIYGGTPSDPDLNDSVVFLPTNDGYLHAFDTKTGEELWAFIPQEVLPQLKELYKDETSATKHYTLDGEITVLKYDVNADGIVDPSQNDRVLLFFGQGRGGNTYYALDVTDKSNPKFMWSSSFPGGGQAWSTPVVTRVNIDGATQNSQKLVLVIGGGYDITEDGQMYVPTAAAGNRLYMVDALKGTLLWSAGPVQDPNTPGAADLQLERMVHSIPSRVTVMDTNFDGYADRMYVGDMAAQIWRFDISNGKKASDLVTGGVIASFGNHGAANPEAADSRRFYNAPDVAAIQHVGQKPFFNIAIGSGYRGHPLNTETQDRFYAVRDLQPFQAMTQAQYDSFDIITEDDLQDVTKDVNPVIAPETKGWFIKLNQPGDEWQGEKVLAAANTFDNKVFFTTYTPTRSLTNTCQTNSAGTGANRSWVVNAINGAPVLPPRDTPSDPENPTDPDGNDGTPKPEDRYQDLAQGGIAPEISFLFPEPNKLVCLSGVEVLSACTNFNSRLKTYWREADAD